MKMLTPHFSLEEMVVSRRAAVLGIDNTPNAGVRANLLRTAYVLEHARALLDEKPIIVTSGYRCAALNLATPGSAKNSAHIYGLAADVICPAFGTAWEVAARLADDRAFMANVDQLIFEFSAWVHIGLAPVGITPRAQVLTKLDAGPYVSGITRRAA